MVPTGAQLDLAVLRALPKVELHVHLEGTFSAPRIVAMAADAGRPLPRPVDQLFHSDDLSEFLRFLDWTCALIRTPQLAAEVAYDFARRAAADGTLYAEVIINPTHWPHWELGELVESLTSGFEQAQADGLTECRLLLSILRTQAAEEALQLVEWMGATRPRRVVGLSIDGDERRAGRTSGRFAPAYARAAQLGYGLTAHAGESSGAEGVHDALDLLHVTRIDHGVRVVDEPELMARLVREHITLNVCLTSNLMHLYPDLKAHPLPSLEAAGVSSTINTDDPGLLEITLTGEFAASAELMNWGYAQLTVVTRRAIEAAFCPPATKFRLHLAVDSFLTTLPERDRQP
ncbi:MAG: adenosine deaminase [Ilumatobacteraceae bacterium]